MKYLIKDENDNVVAEFKNARERKTWTDCHCYLLWTGAKFVTCYKGKAIFWVEI